MGIQTIENMINHNYYYPKFLETKSSYSEKKNIKYITKCYTNNYSRFLISRKLQIKRKKLLIYV